jgi:hypothetical protein
MSTPKLRVPERSGMQGWHKLLSPHWRLFGKKKSNLKRIYQILMIKITTVFKKEVLGRTIAYHRLIDTSRIA